MVTPELIEIITTKIQRGQTRAKIKEELIIEGYADDDIEDAIGQIHRVALQQIPVVAFFMNTYENIEKKSKTLSPTAIVGILGICGGILLLIAFFLYTYFDPLSIQSGKRDEQRVAFATQLGTSLRDYFIKQHRYPSQLSELVPTYLPALHDDSAVMKSIRYVALEDSNTYELCVSFETQAVECIGPIDTTNLSVPVVSPTLRPTIDPSAYLLNGVVYIDTNSNGVRDAGESIYAMAPITVVDSAGKTVCEEFTDEESGSFICEIDGAGTYTATLSVPAEYTAAKAVQTVTFPQVDGAANNTSTLFYGIVPVITAQDMQTPSMILSR